MGARILCGEQHLAHVALAHLVGLAQHPDRLVGRGILALEHQLDEGLPYRLGLPEHPDLLPQLGVLAAEDLLAEGAGTSRGWVSIQRCSGSRAARAAARATAPGAVRIVR